MGHYNNYLAIVVLCIATKHLLCDAAMVKLDLNSTDFSLHYEVKENTTIDFLVEAKVAGWIGLGFNYKNASMFNTDYFMGFANSTGGFGGDYYLATGTSHSAPKRDPENLQNWRVINGTETVNTETNVTTTRLEISRNLNTTDARYDFAITNSTLYLIWAFNNKTDDVTIMHSVKGSQKVNFLTGNTEGVVGDGDGGDKSSIGKGGSVMLSVGIGSLMAITATVMRSLHLQF